LFRGLVDFGSNGLGGRQSNADRNSPARQLQDFGFDPAAIFRDVESFTGKFSTGRQHEFHSRWPSHLQRACHPQASHSGQSCGLDQMLHDVWQSCVRQFQQGRGRSVCRLNGSR
jgi:hypothetical protein